MALGRRELIVSDSARLRIAFDKGAVHIDNNTPDAIAAAVRPVRCEGEEYRRGSGRGRSSDGQSERPLYLRHGGPLEVARSGRYELLIYCLRATPGPDQYQLGSVQLRNSTNKLGTQPYVLEIPIGRFCTTGAQRGRRGNWRSSCYGGVVLCWLTATPPKLR